MICTIFRSDRQYNQSRSSFRIMMADANRRPVTERAMSRDARLRPGSFVSTFATSVGRKILCRNVFCLLWQCKRLKESLLEAIKRKKTTGRRGLWMSSGSFKGIVSTERNSFFVSLKCTIIQCKFKFDCTCSIYFTGK